MLLGLLLLRLPIATPPHAGFALVLILILLANLFWWAWVDGRVLAAEGSRARWRRWFRAGWGAYMLFVLTPVFLLGLAIRRWDAWPVPAIMWAMMWNMLLVSVVSVWAVAATTGSLLARIGRRRKESEPAASPPVNLSRRALLSKVATAVPLIVTAAGVAGGLDRAGNFRIRRIEMKLPRLPERLRGLTITHLSDLHVGRLFRPDHLPAMIEAANRLDSDLVMVTGDIIDHSNDFLPAACDAIAQLKHRYGRLLVVGNHDLLDSPNEFCKYLAAREPHVLSDGYVRLNIGGETVQVAGLFWSRNDQPVGRDPGHAGRASTALAGADPDAFTIGLAHHPHAFDALADRGVDLTLSGHTHGGQLMLTPPGARWPIGAGSLFFRYIWGQYQRGNALMYVNSGIGNWFPVRLNAPAEMVQIRLV